MKEKDSKFTQKLLLFVGPIVIFVLWTAISLGQAVNPILLPSPWLVFNRLWDLVISEDFLTDLSSTLSRLAIGFTTAGLIGVLLGIPLGYWWRFYKSLEFIVDFFRSIPATALFPLFMIFLGIGEEPKIAIVVFACSPIVLVNTVYAVRNSSPTRRIAASTMGARKRDILLRVVLPEALPGVFVGLRTSLSLSLVLVIVSEMFIGTTTGLGYRIMDEHYMYRIPEMYATLVFVGLLGYFLNQLFLVVERRVVRWAGNGF
jgi:NitT/TauT family transport system permease protein